MRKDIEFFRVQRAVVLRDLMLQRIETERMEEEIQKEVGKLKDLHEQAERYRKEKRKHTGSGGGADEGKGNEREAKAL